MLHETSSVVKGLVPRGGAIHARNGASSPSEDIAESDERMTVKNGRQSAKRRG
jgi:hypothetical protein